MKKPFPSTPTREDNYQPRWQLWRGMAAFNVNLLEAGRWGWLHLNLIVTGVLLSAQYEVSTKPCQLSQNHVDHNQMYEALN